MEGHRHAQGELQHILSAPPILKITDNPIHISDIDLDIEMCDAALEEQQGPQPREVLVPYEAARPEIV